MKATAAMSALLMFTASADADPTRDEERDWTIGVELSAFRHPQGHLGAPLGDSAHLAPALYGRLHFKDFMMTPMACIGASTALRDAKQLTRAFAAPGPASVVDRIAQYEHHMRAYANDALAMSTRNARRWITGTR